MRGPEEEEVETDEEEEYMQLPDGQRVLAPLGYAPSDQNDPVVIFYRLRARVLRQLRNSGRK